MRDSCQREINYLRVSVTDRCNLRCIYCMPPEGVPLLDHHEILSLEEIVRAVEAATLVGIRKVRLTGGEPLLRRNLERLIADLAAIPMVDDLSLTTNGILLAKWAEKLRAAGLKRVNISLDTLQPERYTALTRGGNLTDVWRGIDAALDTGLHPVKINTVVLRGFNDDEVVELARLSLDRPLHVRFIELMPVGDFRGWTRDKYVSVAEVRQQIEAELGPLKEVVKPSGAGPARYYYWPGAVGTIGFISGISDHFCHRCNRLRLTSMGTIRPCLFSQEEYELRTLLRRGASQEELAEVFKKAITGKPWQHQLNTGWNKKDRVMSQIGG